MKISAFIPLTNSIKRGDTFIEAINSHLYWADELVVVDGGSTDGTIEAIEALKNPAIRIITREWPQEDWSWTEFCKAWNAGLDACNGDWVAAGETDHIFHQDQAARIRQELEREAAKGKAVVKCQKLQSGAYPNWQSKAQMYYFISKKKFPLICYGFDPVNKTDLCHPIMEEGFYEDIPAGVAIMEGTKYEHLVGGTGANLYNYLWTFKTLDQVVTERMKANKAWNRFSGFTEVYNYRKTEDPEEVKDQVVSQIRSVRSKANHLIPLEFQPELMQRKILNDLKDNMIGSVHFDTEKY